MSSSTSFSVRPRVSSVRRVVAILQQCQTVGFDESLWRHMLLEQMCAMLRLEVGPVVIRRGNGRVMVEQPPRRGRPAGNGAEGELDLWNWLQELDARQLSERLPTSNWEAFAALRRMLPTPANVWMKRHNLELHSHHTSAGDILCLLYLLPGTEEVRLLSARRPRSRAPLRRHDLRLVRMLLLDVLRLFDRGELLGLPRNNGQRLSPREWETLQCLLAGDSEKQIAARLHLSPHTVHTYVKSLYRRFEVSSRGELMALFLSSAVARGAGGRDRLGRNGPSEVNHARALLRESPAFMRAPAPVRPARGPALLQAPSMPASR